MKDVRSELEKLASEQFVKIQISSLKVEFVTETMKQDKLDLMEYVFVNKIITKQMNLHEKEYVQLSTFIDRSLWTISRYLNNLDFDIDFIPYLSVENWTNEYDIQFLEESFTNLNKNIKLPFDYIGDSLDLSLPISYQKVNKFPSDSLVKMNSKLNMQITSKILNQIIPPKIVASENSINLEIWSKYKLLLLSVLLLKINLGSKVELKISGINTVIPK